MSLLMDALKKAEQDKKEASKKGEEGDNRETDTLKLEEESVKENIEPETDNNITSQQQADLHQDIIEDPEDSSIAEGLTLEPISPDASKTQLPPDHSVVEKEDQPEDPEPPDMVDLTITSESKKLDQENTIVDTGSGKEANMDMLVDSSEDVVPDEFLESGNKSTRRVRALISAQELINDLGGGRDKPTPVAAQTVFEAKGSESRGQNVKWAIFILLCLVITGAFSVLYYFSIVPTDYDIKSPMVARDVGTDATKVIIEQTSEDIPVAEIQPEDQTDVIEEPEWKKLHQTTVSEFTGDIGAYSSIVETPVDIQDEDSARVIQQETVPVKGETADTGHDQQTMVIEENIIDTRFESDIQSSTDLVVVEIPSNEIRISKSKSIDGESTTINKAYQAFRHGDLALAENAYMQVLTKFPENRDALLGIAAVAQRKGDNNSAYKFYLEVLKLYPNDVAAQSALIGLNRNIDPVRGESSIKTLLQKQPHAAYLYFMLGNLYAGRENWAKAQQAFFDAHRIDSTNPEYALNLAVSLDHMGLPEAALDYYNKVLALSSDVPVSFDTASVVTRIDTITQKIKTSN